MANPSYTYTLTNGTTADGTQVTQNFTDIINSLTDGTKSLSIDALTCAGAATLNGAVALGNGTPDDITIAGSLASSIPVKTTFSYDLGISTIGWKSFYLGSSDSAAKTTRIIGATVASSWTLTLPTSGGTVGYQMTTNGSGTTSWSPPSVLGLVNCAISASVGSNALTVALKGLDGNDPSATNPVYALFRNVTATSGTPVTRSVTGALSVVVPNTALLGQTSGVAQYIYVYLLDSAGTVELVVSSTLFDEGSVQTTTTMGTGSDAANVLYSTTGRSNVPIRLIGRMLSNQTAAGVWATVPSEVVTVPFIPGKVAWSGHFATNASWARTNTALGLPAVDASSTLTEDQNKNFGTVSAHNDGTPGNNYPGITVNPSDTGTFFIIATLIGVGSNVGTQMEFGLTADNGSSYIDTKGFRIAVANTCETVVLQGLVTLTASTNIDIFMAASANTVTIDTEFDAEYPIKWTVFKIY